MIYRFVQTCLCAKHTNTKERVKTKALLHFKYKSKTNIAEHDIIKCW